MASVVVAAVDVTITMIAGGAVTMTAEVKSSTYSCFLSMLLSASSASHYVRADIFCVHGCDFRSDTLNIYFLEREDLEDRTVIAF